MTKTTVSPEVVVGACEKLLLARNPNQTALLKRDYWHQHVNKKLMKLRTRAQETITKEEASMNLTEPETKLLLVGLALP